MKLNKNFLLIAVAAGCICVGCDDKSGATQQMSTPSKPSAEQTAPNLPPQAQKGLENAGSATATPKK